jgi:membrane-bound lytic murein transglycosylase D
MQLNRQLRFLFVLSSFFISATALAQRGYPPVKDTISGDAFIRMVDQSLSLYYADFAGSGNTDSIVDALGYDAGTVPFFADDIYCQRLAEMNKTSTFGFDCNNVSLSTIKFFAENRRNFAKVVLGRSRLYFDLYEEKLAEYGLPLELKYLSVIESGLRPQVKSRAGALGLWQFMYATGKQYGLTENSYIDERMDPVKATDAACRYLKKLYDIYADWNLALAAYNAGPGNVNKAIKRSGGKRTYWEVRPFLPKETQGYVPNFIAAAYLLTYHAEHNILPAESKIHYYQLDTMCLNSGIHMQTIDKLVGWATEDIQALNPIYKTTYIPPTIPAQCITGPLEKIGLLVSLEDSLYGTEQRLYGAGNTIAVSPPNTNTQNAADRIVVSNPPPEKVIPKTQVVTTVKYTYHKVKSGESLGKIAAQYNVSIQDLMDWNLLTSTRIEVSQMLKIQTKVSMTIENPEYLQSQNQQTNESDTLQETVQTPPANVRPAAPRPAVQKKYYSVRSGDTFSQIASRHGMTLAQLQRLNPGVKATRIQPGQKIRIK